jgi:hypothetical protein
MINYWVCGISYVAITLGLAFIGGLAEGYSNTNELKMWQILIWPLYVIEFIITLPILLTHLLGKSIGAKINAQTKPPKGNENENS